MEKVTPTDRYFGAKRLLAMPMRRGEYVAYRGWQVPADENPQDAGYLVQYEDGYQSWSPSATFEASYRRVDQLTFGQAVEAMRLGKKVSRSGWNGRGMFLYLVPAGRYAPSTPAGREIAGMQGDLKVPYLPYIAMKTVSGEVVPWLASQTDVLGEDWMLVDGETFAVEHVDGPVESGMKTGNDGFPYG